MEETKELSIKDGIDKTSTNVTDLLGFERELKKDIEFVKKEILSMNINLDSLIDATPKPVLSRLADIYSDLKSEISSQKSMNEYLQKQITSLKKERSIIGQHIVINNNHTSILQEKVGFTSNRP